jgi:hypothetical protein
LEGEGELSEKSPLLLVGLKLFVLKRGRESEEGGLTKELYAAFLKPETMPVAEMGRCGIKA